MEKEPIKVTGLISGEHVNTYAFTTDKPLTGLPIEKVMKEIEKAINKVKPLDIPTL